MANRLGILGAVFHNGVLRRLEGAFVLFAVGEWSTWVAMIVYAYGRGGATEAGLTVCSRSREIAQVVSTRPW